jgi:hypothetical protein
MDNLTKLIADNKERPIADAPKDGKFIIVSNPDDPDCNPCVVKENNEIDPYWEMSESNGWDADSQLPYIPTHFRLIPDDRLALVAEVIVDGVKQTIMTVKNIMDGLLQAGILPSELANYACIITRLEATLHDATTIAAGGHDGKSNDSPPPMATSVMKHGTKCRCQTCGTPGTWDDMEHAEKGAAEFSDAVFNANCDGRSIILCHECYDK